MFRTEVVKSKNLKKSVLFKVINAISVIVFVLILFTLFTSKGADNNLTRWIEENYNSTAKPIILAVLVMIVVFSMYVNSQIKNPKRLGTLEIDEKEFRYIENDEIVETTVLSELTAVDFEFFSIRMRGNPSGCINYLTLNKNTASKTYEIVIGNSMEKAELGDLLRTMNDSKPVKVTYSYWLKKLFKDKDFKF